MSEFDGWPTIGPQNLLMKQMQQKNFSIAAPNEFDPYQALLKRKKQQDSGELPPVKDINPDDLYELQQFCQMHGIVGFNFGKMNPKAALQMLKYRMGIRETPTPPPSKKSILFG